MHPCVHRSIIYNHQHTEQPKCPSIGEWIKRCDLNQYNIVKLNKIKF